MTYPFNAFTCQMLARFHHQHNAAKLLERNALLSLQRVLEKKWNDTFKQMLVASYTVSHPVAVIPANHAAPEVPLQRVQNLYIAFVLYNGEFR